MALHTQTREYTRNLLQTRLNDLVVELSQASGTMTPANRIAEISEEIGKVSRYIADVLTHHIDEQSAPAAPNREQAAAVHLYRNVMRNADTIRDMEVRLGLKGDDELARLHSLLHDMRVFCDHENNKQRASNGGKRTDTLPGLPNGPLTAQQ